MQDSTNSTPEEIKKATDLENQKKAETEAETAVIKKDTELANQRKAKSEADTAATNAEIAATKAKFGEIPVSGYNGVVTTGTDAGKAEALLLGAVAINKIADKLTWAIKEKKPDGLTKLLLFTSTTPIPDFQALLAFNAQLDALKYIIADAKDKTSAVDLELDPMSLRTTKADMQGSEYGATTAQASLGLGLDAFNKLLGYFKTDYTFQGIEVTSNDTMLLSALAGKLQSENIKVMIPSLYNPGIFEKTSEVRKQITEIYSEGLNAAERIRHFNLAQVALEGKLKEKPDDEKLKKILEQVKDAVAIWNDLAKFIDSWIKVVAQPDEKGNLPLAKIIDQAAIKTELDTGAGFALVQLHQVQGSAYTKKNLWSSLFWFTPFYVMSGAVASLMAFTGKDGEIFASVLVPWHGGYKNVTDVQSEVKKSIRSLIKGSSKTKISKQVKA